MGKTVKVHESDTQPLPEKSGWSSFSTITTFDRGKTHSLNWRREGAVVPRRISAFTPSSVFVESLIEQLCKLFEKDPKSQKKLYGLICKKLHDMHLIDETYMVEEFQFMRSHYQQALIHLLSVSKSPAIDRQLESFFSQSPSYLSLLPPISSGIFDRSRYQEEFEEIEFIERGGFGRVYKAKNKIDGCEYAIKKICLRYYEEDPFFQSLREVRTLAKLDHHNIVAYKAAWFEQVNNLVPAEDWSSSSGSKTTPDIEPSDEAPESSSVQRESREEGEDDSGDIVFANGSASGAVLDPSPLSHSLRGAGGVVSECGAWAASQIPVGGMLSVGGLCDHSSGASNKGCRGRKVADSGRRVAWAILYIQMQLYNGSLRKWLDVRSEALQGAGRGVPRGSLLLPADCVVTALRIFREILRGVEYMHKKNVVHHDLKPSNIFVEGYECAGVPLGAEERQQVRVGDFGLACHLAHPHSSDPEPVATMAVVPKDTVGDGRGCLVQGGEKAVLGDAKRREVIGTRLYAAPEQLDGHCNPKSDMYSLAIILFELLNPFFTAMERGKMIAELRVSGDVPEEFRCSHPALGLLIKDMLSENPSSRPSIKAIIGEVELELLSHERKILRARSDSFSFDDEVLKEGSVSSDGQKSRSSSFTETYEVTESSRSICHSFGELFVDEMQTGAIYCQNFACSNFRMLQEETICRLRAENLKKDELIEELLGKIMKLENLSMKNDSAL